MASSGHRSPRLAVGRGVLPCGGSDAPALAGAKGLLRGAVVFGDGLMGSPPTTLTQSEIDRFERDGYVVVRQGFPRADALAMQDRWWAELETVHHIRRDDRSTWRPIPGDL